MIIALEIIRKCFDDYQMDGWIRNEADNQRRAILS